MALAVIGAVLFLAAVTQRETLPPARRRVGGFADTRRALGGVLRDRSFLVPALVFALVCCGMFVYIAMGSYVLQGEPYRLGAQAYGIVFAVNAVGIALASRVTATLVRRIGAPRSLVVAVAVSVTGGVSLLLGVLLTDSVWAVLPPLFLVVSSVGIAAPTGTALALAGQGEAAGSASALLGLLQFAFGAVVPPLVSLGGVSAVRMAVPILAAGLAEVPPDGPPVTG